VSGRKDTNQKIGERISAALQTRDGARSREGKEKGNLQTSWGRQRAIISSGGGEAHFQKKGLGKGPEVRGNMENHNPKAERNRVNKSSGRAGQDRQLKTNVRFLAG